MLSSLFWVPGTAAKPVPVQYEPTEDQIPTLDDIDGEEGFEKDDQMEEDTPDVSQKEKTFEETYNLDTYDDEDDGIVYGDNLDEVLLGEEDGGVDLAPEDEQEDMDDQNIKPTDAIIVAAHSAEDTSQLYMYIYEESEDNLYLHHDIFLAAFPLCLAWTDCLPSQTATGKGNLAAVGSFLPGIEIWDLDVLDPLEPLAILGGFKNETPGPSTEKKKKNKKKKKEGEVYKEGSHLGAVMSLSWNSQARNLLASGSADTTVKVWDLPKETCLASFTHHKDKVQAVEWHPSDAQILLCGGYDKKVSLLDARYPNAVGWADTESAKWDPLTPACFMVSTEDGNVRYFDSRKLDSPLWTLQAHSKTCSAVSFNPSIPNFFATGSADKTVKLWTKTPEPKLLHSIGAEMNIFTLGFYSQSPLLLCGGGKLPDEETADDPLASIKLWHCSQFSAVTNHFKNS